MLFSELGLEPRIFSLDKRCFNLLSYSEKSISVAVNIYKILEPQVEFESTTFSMARRYASQLHHWDKNISYVVSSNQLINTLSGRYYIYNFKILEERVGVEPTSPFGTTVFKTAWVAGLMSLHNKIRFSLEPYPTIRWRQLRWRPDLHRHTGLGSRILIAECILKSKTNGGLEPHRYSSCDSYPFN